MDAVLLSLESLYHPHHLIAKASSSVDPVFIMSCRRKPMCLCRSFLCFQKQAGDRVWCWATTGAGLHPVAHKCEMPLGIDRYCCPHALSRRKPCTQWSYIYSEVPPPHLGHWDVGALRILYRVSLPPPNPERVPHCFLNITEMF